MRSAPLVVGRPGLAVRVLAITLTVLAVVALAPRRAAAQAAPASAVAARDLPRGAVLTAADIEQRPGPAATAGAARPGPGWVTRRVVRAGEVLREPAVAPPQLVHAGETVDVLWRGTGVQLSLRGTAARSAGEGERVAVRIGTGWRLEGVVVGEGVVQIEPQQEGTR